MVPVVVYPYCTKGCCNPASCIDEVNIVLVRSSVGYIKLLLNVERSPSIVDVKRLILVNIVDIVELSDPPEPTEFSDELNVERSPSIVLVRRIRL